jgi:hypothetical protein
MIASTPTFASPRWKGSSRAEAIRVATSAPAWEHPSVSNIANSYVEMPIAMSSVRGG